MQSCGDTMHCLTLRAKPSSIVVDANKDKSDKYGNHENLTKLGMAEFLVWLMPRVHEKDNAISLHIRTQNQHRCP